MIITTYGKDGTKSRKLVGYAGQACNKAAEPYEAREIPGSVKKTATPDMFRDDTEAVAEQTHQQIGE